MQEAIEKAKDSKQEAKPIISGIQLESGEKVPRENPSFRDRVVGTVTYADTTATERAIQTLSAGAEQWRALGVEKRSSIIRTVGALIRENRRELAAMMVHEIGKPWAESDADVAEAADFCEYYGLLAPELMKNRKMQEILGEENWFRYEPTGIFAVIAPWNFALAIPCGMTVAALVTGNAAILKPAEQSSLIAARFSELLLEAGVLTDAYAFLPGRGEVVGQALIDSPDLHGVVFTGSKEVGLSILRTASHFDEEHQHHVKKVIAEMGGKNAIVVDEDADSDEVVKGVLKSTFAFSGQKCSACSRLIVVGEMYEPLLERLCQAAADLQCGPAEDPGSFFGPVIDAESRKRILSLIEEQKEIQNLAFRGTAPEHGHYVPACIFRDVDLQSTLWRDEIFGPVLACSKARDFESAVALANRSRYALTGGVFSRSPRNLAYAKERFQSGNLYLNRSITGAIVGRQPFGGYKLSGVGSKAGGPDYLLQFVVPRTVTENTLRRGFTPELT